MVVAAVLLDCVRCWSWSSSSNLAQDHDSSVKSVLQAWITSGLYTFDGEGTSNQAFTREQADISRWNREFVNTGENEPD